MDRLSRRINPRFNEVVKRSCNQTRNGALFSTRPSTEAVPARAHVFEITINIERQLEGMFSQMIRAPDIYQSCVYVCTCVLQYLAREEKGERRNRTAAP